MPLGLPRSARSLAAIAALVVVALVSFHQLASPASFLRIGSGHDFAFPRYAHYPPTLPERAIAAHAKGDLLAPPGGAQGRKANATFVMLARNGDLGEVISSMQGMEDRFNWWAGYDWVFLNEEPFTDEFKKLTSELASTTCHYGLIPGDHWLQPDWIDEERATKAREKMAAENVIYGDSKPYRSMCRFNSGFFFRHPLLQKYRYYWRVEPSVKFYCDIRYDPFLVMEDEKKVYGFTISLFEYTETIVTLWDSVKEFMKLHPEHIAKDNSMGFLSDDDGKEYNHCHFWSNFEIADLDFWRSDAYMAFFEHLDVAGGFWYERWGDAPVHSIAAGLLAPKDQIKFFSDIGYYHGPWGHCPTGQAHAANRCACKEEDNFDDHWFSCTKKWKAIHPGETWYGSGSDVRGDM